MSSPSSSNITLSLPSDTFALLLVYVLRFYLLRLVFVYSLTEITVMKTCICHQQSCKRIKAIKDTDASQQIDAVVITTDIGIMM